jgi:S-adenosylmethionine synthetase
LKRYGPAPKNSDSAVNILLDVVQDQSGKQYKMDHYATRYPTNVLDVAQFLVRLCTHPFEKQKPLLILISKTSAAASSRPSLPPIIHYSAPEPYTKFEMCLVFAKILHLPITHIIPDADAPQGAAAASRPRDCQLYTKETEELMVDDAGGLGTNGFEEWWTGWLAP